MYLYNLTLNRASGIQVRTTPRIILNVDHGTRSALQIEDTQQSLC